MIKSGNSPLHPSSPPQNISTARYAKNITFEDPISKYSDLDGYLFMIQALRTFFNIKYELHSLEVAGQDELVAR
jgi:hypothetical protein